MENIHRSIIYEDEWWKTNLKLILLFLLCSQLCNICSVFEKKNIETWKMKFNILKQFDGLFLKIVTQNTKKNEIGIVLSLSTISEKC